jgi:hypothetical protein
MGGETDFHKLYQELGLAPGCEMAALTLAYRRRVAELHPDRNPAATDAASDERLRNLIALYEAAQRFHKRYGRLPGTAASFTPAPRPVLPERAYAEPPPRATRSWAAWLALPLLALLLWLAWDVESPEPVAAPADGDNVATRSAPDVVALQLVLGMDPDSVRSIQGPPPLDLGDRWEYGPSYLRFEHRRLVDWYSSPMQPLKTATSRPVQTPPPPTLH